MALDAGDLAQAMTDELDEAWRFVKGEDFPGDSREDARIMFVAIARGLLLYLEAHKTDMVNTIQFSGGSPITVTSVDINSFVEPV